MLGQSFAAVVSLLLSLLLLSAGPTGATTPSSPAPSATDDFSPEPEVTEPRRVNAPRFDDEVVASQSAVFWFGRVTPTENSVDVRVGYNDDHLRIRVAAFDRRLWYDDASPTPDELAAWDAVTLYLNRDGNLDTAPEANAYRFDAQLVWWEHRDDYQAAYRGNGSGWVGATVSFTTTSGWRGNEPNDDIDDRGWWLAYEIPFESLELSGPPARGKVWGMGLALHDREDAGGTPIADQVWPEAMTPQQPSSWGQLAFGMPGYDSPPAISEGTTTIRQGVDEATVVDADVGGSSVCGQSAAPDYFSVWGELNYAGKEFVNIQNQGDVADWPCFSKYYVTFPLDAVPAEKVIMSATLTLHLFGSAGAGWDLGPQPSLIQVLAVGEGWDERTLTWNNAPLAVENVSSTWVEPVDEYAEPPGVPYEWDLSRAVAEAYAKAEPLRLALYEADYAYHSGKYFHSSDYWMPEARPTLTVTWGHPLANVDKTAAPASGDEGTSIAYTLSFLGSGNTLTLTDTLPVGVTEPEDIQVKPMDLEKPMYDDKEHRLTWSDTPSIGEEATIRYTAAIVTGDSEALVNTVELSEAGGDTSTATAVVIANPQLVYLPLVFREN